MEKVEPPKQPGSKDADQGGQEGNQTFGTDDIWKNALKRFQTENKIAETEMKDIVRAGDLGEADTGVEKATQLFKTWRHPPGPNTKAMIAVSGCLGWVDTATGFIQDHVSGTYATPAKIITGSISKMIKAAQDMSEDFNLIEKTFNDIHEAIKDIGLLDRRARNEKEDHFVHRLTDIFISLFDFCYFSTKMFELSRKRRYIRALFKGRNEKIQEKCDNVTTVILLFRATVPLKILSEVEKMNQKMDEMPDTFRKVIQGLNASDLLPLTQRSSILEKVRRRFGVNPTDMSHLESHMLLIKSNYVEGTFSWLKDNSDYKDWFRAQKTPFLCVSGPQGTGKTYLTYRCYQLLQEMIKPKTLTTETSKTRQNISVAYFFFDPGSETHSLKNALENLIVQIASQDSKYCDSLSKDIDKKGFEASKGDTAETLWKTFLSTKFEKTSEASRMAYILLDGIDLLSEEDLKALLDLFQDLGCDKTAIQIMMTGIPDKLKEMNLKPCEINLVARSKEHGDIKTIIAHRIKNMKNLKEFSEDNRKKIMEHLDSQSEGVISFVDLSLTVMDQSGNETSAMKQMDWKYSPTKLYESMIEVVMDGRSPSDRISVPTLFAWCTYAKERLSVHELQQIWELDPSLNRDFNVLSEIQGKSKIMLYTTKRVTTEEGSRDDEQQPIEEDDPTITPTTGAIVSGAGILNDPKLEVVEFRQPALKAHMDNPVNKMIEDPLKAKVQIFTTLCKVLCDNSASEAESRKVLHKYAASNLVNHLLDIDLIATTPQQGKDVVEWLSKVLTNENNVCAIFEAVLHDKDDYYVSFSLYDESDTAKRILAWAKKMSFFEDEELADTAREWIEATVKDSGKLFESLAKGHVENLSKKVLAEEAWQPYRLAYHALGRIGRIAPNYDDDDYFYAWYMGRMNAKAANAIIEFSNEFLKDAPIDVARIRIALAMLLNTSDNSDDRKRAADLYNLNLESDDNTPGPEKFYSYVGLAEYYYSPLTEDETQDASKTRWENVVKNTDLALQQREDEKEALGSELDNECCTRAFWLKGDAHHKLDQDTIALETCTKALDPNELEYSKKNKQLLNFLTLIITIHAKKDNYYPIIALIQNCQYRMRADWLWHRWDFVTDKTDSLRKAAVMTRRVDFLIQVYEEAIEYHKDNQNWFGAQILSLDLAIIYRRDSRATRMAETTLDNIMKEVKNNMSRSDVAEVLRYLFPHMVDLLFENFYAARSKAKKEEEVAKLYRLVHDLGSTSYIEQMSLAQALLTLAKMLRGIGRVRHSKAQADRAFKLCMDDLQDLVTYNDKAAFRIFGKVLMFADLQVDAEIALSLQYSEVDRAHEDSQTYEPSVAAATNDDGASVAASGINGAAPSTTGEPPNVRSDQNGIDQNGVEPNTTENSKQKAAEESQPKPDQNGVNPEAMEGLEKEAEKPQQKIPIAETPKLWPEDLIPKDQRTVRCNGPCSNSFDTFQGGSNAYFCIDCFDVDLCSECHEKQVLYYTQIGEGFWFKGCWAEHKYIKLPVEGWRGVKNGVIRIGSKQKPFKFWLLAVRDKWNAKLAAMG